MRRTLDNQRGSAMVLALGALVVLAVLAMVVLSISVSEKKTAFTDYTDSRAFYSADAAGEAGVNWLRQQWSAPSLLDSLNHVRVSNTFTPLANSNQYRYDVTFMRKRYRPGWPVEFKDYEFRVEATGASAQEAVAAVEVGATRLYREGY